jgi:hypothetical protein
MRPLSASKSIDPDTPSVWDTMPSEYSEAWMEAMRAEIKSLLARMTSNIVERSQAGSKHAIPCTWSMRKKIFPVGHFTENSRPDGAR